MGKSGRSGMLGVAAAAYLAKCKFQTQTAFIFPFAVHQLLTQNIHLHRHTQWQTNERLTETKHVVEAVYIRTN